MFSNLFGENAQFLH